MMFNSKRWVLGFLFLAVATVGCDRSVGGLTGALKIDGKPAPAGVGLEFIPVERGKRQSSAKTDASGNFKAIYTFSKDGAAVGESVAKLAYPEIVPGPDGKIDLPYPEKYYQEIKTITVTPGANQVELEISTAP